MTFQIKNPDAKPQVNEEHKAQILNALQSEDPNAFAEAMAQFANSIQKDILDQARKEMNEVNSDNQILSSRGVHLLTTEEKEYYNEVIAAEGFGGVDKLVPPTTINRVFDDLQQNHPLLSRIEFQNVTGTSQWLVNTSGQNPAWWGKLCDDIKQLLTKGFELISVDLFKLSAYIPVCKAMLDLGPEWLDRYVRAVLEEAMAIGLEEGIVKGSGKDEPVGMIRDLKGAVVDGVYPEKTAVPLTDLSPATLGAEVMAKLAITAKDESGNPTMTRVVESVLMVVNPVDYWTTLFGALSYRVQTGQYVFNLPVETDIVPSNAVPLGKMIVGVARDYFMGVGSTRKIEYSDEVRFIEDERVYISKQYANGRPKTADSFLVFDISGINAPAEPETP